MQSDYYQNGVWHALIGIAPQYDHMIGAPMYEKYMKGYNTTKNEIESEKNEQESKL
jgi:hypothetical protein